MEPSAIDLAGLFKHGISGSLVAIIWYLIHQKQIRNGGSSKHDFLEKLGAMMDAQTVLLTKANTHLEKIEPIVIAVDPVTNFPRVWSDSPQQKRTHDNVSNVLDATEELSKTTAEIHERVVKRG